MGLKLIGLIIGVAFSFQAQAVEHGYKEYENRQAKVHKGVFFKKGKPVAVCQKVTMTCPDGSLVERDVERCSFPPCRKK